MLGCSLVFEVLLLHDSLLAIALHDIQDLSFVTGVCQTVFYPLLHLGVQLCNKRSCIYKVSCSQ